MAKWGGEGCRYVGMWQDDLPEGRGAELDERGVLLYEGEWKAGKRDGFGTEFEQGRPVYSGGWHNGKHSGEGTLLLENGHRLVGSAESGFAVEYDETGAKIYEGEWAGGVRCGKGSLFLPSGERIDGQFENGALTGSAVLCGRGAARCLKTEKRYMKGILCAVAFTAAENSWKTAR